ncbi:hypothetical protein K0M31_014019 [Melipona bicolor]|uniref:Uncharacterized protein n=1 Tax=Melipona bicolor TaxID=60889 RepID=A0AA40G7Q8_9HYME|nr:hypothetical protein K0M31_014019 [Melipona bicolor]
MAPGETGDFCNDHYHGGSALDVELTRRVGTTTLEEGTEVAVAVETSGSWRRVRASSETPWEPTSSAKKAAARRGGMKLESNGDALEFTCSSICGDAQIDGEDRFGW